MTNEDDEEKKQLEPSVAVLLVMRNKISVMTKKTLAQPIQSGAYGSIDALKRATTLERSVVMNWLSYQDAYNLHKPIGCKFPIRCVIAGGLDHQWQANLIDVKSLRKDNDGLAHLLTCVDVLSKYAWVIPLRNKTRQVNASNKNQYTPSMKMECDCLYDWIKKTVTYAPPPHSPPNGEPRYIAGNAEEVIFFFKKFCEVLSHKVYFDFLTYNDDYDILQSCCQNFNVHVQFG